MAASPSVSPTHSNQCDKVLPPPPLTPHQQNQPKNSLDLIAFITKDLTELTTSKEEDIIKEIESAVDKLYTSMETVAKYPEDTFHQINPPICTVLSTNNAQFKKHLKSFILAQWHVKRSFTGLILSYLASITTPLEEDETGYIAGNLIVFSETFDKICGVHKKALEDLQSSYHAVLSNGAYDQSTRSKITTLGSLFIFKHHTKCYSCKEGPVVGHGLINSVPLCFKCISRENLTSEK